MSIASLAPDYIRAIMAYQPGKPISELAREMGIPEESIVKLASNENPLGMSARARDAAITAIGEISRYPDGGAFALKKALCARFGVQPAQLVIGNGSNDILELASQAFLAPGLSAVYSRHAFAVYPLATNARGARGIEVAAKNFGHDLDAMAAAIEPQTRVVFIANPNNPTGTFVPGAELEAFLAKVPRHVLVVLDEAYTEYLAPEQRYDSIAWLARFPNLLVSRTFSKAYGLA
ncbi:MAG: aminotransferase class I/II-fold pyridoxal phosphate-dependent enzyme, partial [Thauera sp.]|nr:aminotransferase class I/II-fold pyridoxal phosphate-dependent enzyme [Thauera sp.]